MNKINILFLSTLTIFVNFAIGYYHQNTSVSIYIHCIYIYCVSDFVCVCVFVCVYVYTYNMHMNSYAHVHIHLYTCAYTSLNMHMCYAHSSYSITDVSIVSSECHMGLDRSRITQGPEHQFACFAPY